MKIDKRLKPLVEEGLIDEVISRLMSGKEADIFVVRCQGHLRCAKVYKEAYKRNFKKSVQYQEGRTVRGGRRARALEKRSKYGRQEQEKIWQDSEVTSLARLDKIGVRVPKTYFCLDGVLLMELITIGKGDVAPRLANIILSEQQAKEDFSMMMHYVRLMLCEGLIHGDLSEFNVLVDDYGPVIIDLPQAIDAASNNSAKSLFFRDVHNMVRYYGQFLPELLDTQFAEEMWALYEAGELTPETELTGRFQQDIEEVDLQGVVAEIKAVIAEEEARLERLKGSE